MTVIALVDSCLSKTNSPPSNQKSSLQCIVLVLPRHVHVAVRTMQIQNKKTTPRTLRTPDLHQLTKTSSKREDPAESPRSRVGSFDSPGQLWVKEKPSTTKRPFGPQSVYSCFSSSFYLTAPELSSLRLFLEGAYLFEPLSTTEPALTSKLARLLDLEVAPVVGAARGS